LPAAQPRAPHITGIALEELSLELARLDLGTSKLGDRVVELLSSFFATDRVSLSLVSQGRVTKAFSRGFEVPNSSWIDDEGVLHDSLTTGLPVLCPNILEHQRWAGERLKNYRTGAFAVYPLRSGRRIVGSLCISNLSTQQITQLEAAGPKVDLVLAQLAQICKLLESEATRQIKPARNEPVCELTLIGRLHERLEANAGARNVMSIFAEVVADMLPAEAIASIHSRIREPQQAVVAVQRQVHSTELDTLLASIAQQWMRRQKNTTLRIGLQDATVLNDELVCSEGECTDELKLHSTEVFPVFLDNELFAIVALATTERFASDTRAMTAFSVMAHALFSYVKKRLLLAQNTEMETRDGLTGLMNERQFYQMLEREFERASRYSSPLTLCFVDIDHFKDINDSYGFEVGDQVLLDLSRIVKENMRGTDFASRYSGERFVVVLPETGYGSAEIMAERLRRYVENHSFYIPNSNVFIKVTASIGVASYLDHKPASVAQFIEFADTALYFAKRNGRNQVVGYGYVMSLMVSETKHKG
jgi:diguanylate cyclase (GGDEF)-like protein